VPPPIHIERATSATDEVRALVAELEATLAAGYPPEQRHGLAVEALFQPHLRFFLARREGETVGCGGVALFPEFAEVKRMFVRPAARGTGVAGALLSRIEATCRGAGQPHLCLETGDRQLAAIRFYERQGFTRCAPFGDYLTMTPQSISTSVFLEKRLD